MKNLLILILAFMPLLIFADDARVAQIECLSNEIIKTKNCGNCGPSKKGSSIYVTKGLKYTTRKGVEYIIYSPFDYSLTEGQTVSFSNSNVRFDLSDIKMTESEFAAFIESCACSSCGSGGGGSGADWNTDLTNIPPDIADGDDVDDADFDPTNEIQDAGEVQTIGAITIDGVIYPIGTSVQVVLDAIAAADAAGLDCTGVMTCFDATELTAAQITDLMSVLDFSQLTQDQKDDLCALVQITVNSGTTATSTDNSGGEVIIDCDDILHFWNSGGAINVTTTAGSAVVDIALKISTTADNQVQIDGTGLYVPAFVEVDGDVTNEIQNADEVNVTGGDFVGLNVEEALDSLARLKECTIEATEIAHGITFTELTPIWYTSGVYVDNLPVGTDTFPPVGLLKSVIDANTLELVRCGFEETTYSDGYYYATNSGVSITPTQDNETPIFIAHDGIASVNLDHVYGSGAENTDIVTRTKTIDSLSQESYIFCDSVFVNGVFDFVYCDTLLDNCISLSDTYIVDAAKVLTNTAAFTNVKMNGDEVVWNDLNSATSTAPGQISFISTSSANSKSKMDIGILSMEVQGVSGFGMAATIGISKQDYSTSRFTADYEFYFGVGGNLMQIRVKGNVLSVTPTYAIGDVFEIEITETDVIFRKNSNVLATVSENNQLLPCLTVKEHLSLIALQLKESRNQSISLIHSEYSETVTQSKSQEIITVPASLAGTVMSVTYSSPTSLYAITGNGFEASLDVIRAGVTTSNIAPIDIGVIGTFSASSSDPFEVQEGDIIRVSVDQLSSNVVSGLTATINFTK